jgi:hypothetical protein
VDISDSEEDESLLDPNYAPRRDETESEDSQVIEDED